MPDVKLLKATLVVPTYNEELAIYDSLTFLSETDLPHGICWYEWILLDGSSSDNTINIALKWAKNNPEIPLRVQKSSERKGKAMELEELRLDMLYDKSPPDIVVVSDADSNISPDALKFLLDPFLRSSDIAVVWGLPIPRGSLFKRRASRFQMLCNGALVRAGGSQAIRAEGRIFAFRLSSLKEFSWRPGMMNDDTQLAAYVRQKNLPHLSVPEATTHVLPAAGWKDFYLQTYRYYAAEKKLSKENNSPVNDNQDFSFFLKKVYELSKVIIRDPLGAIAYAIARIVAFSRHKLAPTSFEDTWAIATSTKGIDKTSFFGGYLYVTNSLKKKFLEFIRVTKTCKNWPQVSAILVLGHLPLFKSYLPKNFVFISRSKLRLEAPQGRARQYPIIEVLVNDAYHLDQIYKIFNRHEGLSIVDIGAHVGAFTVAVSEKLPQATIICCEPAFDTVSYLSKNLQQNGIMNKVQIINQAVGSRVEKRVLYRSEEASCEASLFEDLSGIPAHDLDTVVDVIDVASVFAIAKNPEIIKLDCEGSEYEIILESDPSIWDSVNCVLIEYHSVIGHNWTELLARFREFGLDCLWHENGHENGFGTAMLLRKGLEV